MVNECTRILTSLVIEEKQVKQQDIPCVSVIYEKRKIIFNQITCVICLGNCLLMYHLREHTPHTHTHTHTHTLHTQTHTTYSDAHTPHTDM